MMENNGKNHNTRLWISFDAPHKGANIPIGDQSFIDFFGGISKTAEEARDKKLSSNSAKQMLLHHYLAGTTLPSGAPNFRNSWQTELDNLGYPQNLRKIALINGAINGTTQGTACQNVFKMKVDLFVRTLFMRIGIIRMSESKVSFAGSYGSNCEVFDGWVYTWLNANKKNAAAPASSKSYDIIPGGYYNAQEEITEKDGWSTIFKPSWTSKIKLWTAFTLYNHYHCFIPTFSALGMDITNKDLSENLYNRDLTCTGETPFQAYYAPMVNQEHITLTAENVAWIKAEIAGNKQPSSVNYAVLYPFVQTSGTDPACTNATFQINNLPSGSTISWQSSNPAIATVPATGNPVTLTRQGAQSGAITITATITRPCSESNLVMTKTITVGTPSLSGIGTQRWGNSCYYDAVVTLSASGTTVDFSFDNVTWFAGIQSGDKFRSGSGDLLGPMTQTVYARARNTCGTSPVISRSLHIPSPPGGCLMYLMPPESSRITGGNQGSETNMASRENISVYPNPAGNKLTVTVPPLPGNTVISIYDAGGKPVYNGRLNNATNDLNISSYRSGLYLVRIVRDGAIIKSVKIIKQ